MSLDILKERGVPVGQQLFTWKDVVSAPISKLNDDAFTRSRILLMAGLEAEAVRFSHACARMNAPLQVELARLRRIDQHQRTAIQWLLPADLSPLEATCGYEQLLIELSASIAQQEPELYLAAACRFALLEDFDHLYRFAALGDRLLGIDANNLLQGYTDVVPGRPAKVAHRAPEDDVRHPYDARKVAPISKLHVLTLLGAAQQVFDYYMVVGPQLADPLARQLYAEIASIEEQHVTHYESLADPLETWIEKWLLHKATEIYNYASCAESEANERVKAMWTRFCEYELGQFHHVRLLFQQHEGRDVQEVIGDGTLPKAIAHASQRKFIRETLNRETHLRACGPQLTDQEISAASIAYRDQVNGKGSPSEQVASGFRYRPGTELARRRANLRKNPREGAW
jgi:hypothetical protein